MFYRNQHGKTILSPSDCEDIARCAETFGVEVSLAPQGLKIAKTKHSLRGSFSDRRLIPWSVFAHHNCPAHSIKADIQTLSHGIDKAIEAGRGRF